MHTLYYCTLVPGITSKRKFLGQVEIEEIVKNYNYELNADAVALQLAIKYGTNKHFDLSAIFSGIEFFFSIVEIMEQASGFKASETHPTASARRESLRTYFKEYVDEHDVFFEETGKRANGEELLQTSKSINNLIAKLWLINKCFFDEMLVRFRAGLERDRILASAVMAS